MMDSRREKLLTPHVSPHASQFDPRKLPDTKGERQSQGDDSEDARQRVAHACTPCRRSKIKCDGMLPCGMCEKRRSKPRCTYRPKQLKFIAVKLSPSVEGATRQELPSFHREGLHGHHSLAVLIEQYKALVLSAQNVPSDSAVARCEGREAFEAAARDAASMSKTCDEAVEQSIFGFCPVIGESLLHEPPESTAPELGMLHRSAISVQQKINGGRPFEAWLDMPGLVRQAEFSLLRVNESDPIQMNYWRQLWFLITGLDVRINMLIGRRTAVVSARVIQRPTYENSAPRLRRFEKSCLDFQQYSLPILDRLSLGDSTSTEIMDYETLLPLTNLEGLRQIMNNIHELASAVKHDRVLAISVANHHLEVNCFHLMLSCLLARSKQRQMSMSLPHQEYRQSQRSDNAEQAPRQDTGSFDEAVYKHRTEIAESCHSIIALTKHVTNLERNNSNCNWVRDFIAYTAISILGIESLRSETMQHSVIATIHAGKEIFEHKSTEQPQQEFANLASRRICDLWSEINNIERMSTAQQTIPPGTGQRYFPRKRRRSSAYSSSVNKRIHMPGQSNDISQSPHDMHSLGSQSQAIFEPAHLHPNRHPLMQEMVTPELATTEAPHSIPNQPVQHANIRAPQVPLINVSEEQPSMTFHKPGWNRPNSVPPQIPMTNLGDEPTPMMYRRQSWNPSTDIPPTPIGANEVDYEQYFGSSMHAYPYATTQNQYWNSDVSMLQQQGYIGGNVQETWYCGMGETTDWQTNGMGDNFHRPGTTFYTT